MKSKITIIGAGNVGTHLAQRLYKCGHQICQIFSRTPSKATALANRVNSQGINQLKELSLDADIYILAIKDDATKTIAEEVSFLNKYQKIIAHTSGSVPSTVFKNHFEHYGVFYPLQTFSSAQTVDFEQLPFCIYGNSPQTQTILKKLAESICPNVYLINDEQRAILHVTAVIVNNFSNYLYHIAHDICTDNKVSFDILKPLIQETVRKISLASPKEVQTGPAVRGDANTIARHLAFLAQYPEYQKLYKILSSNIEQQFNKDS
ncbi:Rossmann-like and DUF2520 domain-containing protein [Aureispira anguillae]|uniref:F420-dependent NADP oxidoreductase n=1 Tax=Aureispira anguillae TaxID=2864201 RepID=A0A915YES1_9BACT|nr:Rossmann-like and DUF2520 domain-containing protein [Aureispira anguillae]BDS11792.1 F420-dependent NADP oxidoreductase [Aureispira anguillae]